MQLEAGGQWASAGRTYMFTLPFGKSYLVDLAPHFRMWVHMTTNVCSQPLGLQLKLRDERMLNTILPVC